MYYYPHLSKTRELRAKYSSGLVQHHAAYAAVALVVPECGRRKLVRSMREVRWDG